MIVCSNKLATQLSRPRIFKDELIAQAVEAEIMEKQPEEEDAGVTIERIA